MSYKETRDTAVVFTQYMQRLPMCKEGTPPGVAKSEREEREALISLAAPISYLTLMEVHAWLSAPSPPGSALAPQLLRLDPKWPDPGLPLLAPW